VALNSRYFISILPKAHCSKTLSASYSCFTDGEIETKPVTHVFHAFGDGAWAGTQVHLTPESLVFLQTGNLPDVSLQGGKGCHM
jgi:hypothetical protein